MYFQFSIDITFLLLFSAQLIAWPSDELRNLTSFIRPHVNTTIISPINHCNSSKTFLNIIVISALYHEDQRNAIRRTWGSKKRINDRKIVVNFLVGQTNNNTLTVSIGLFIF